LEGRRVGRLGEGRDVLGVRLVPDRGGHLARSDDDDIDAEQHQLAAQRFREAFEAEFRGAVGTEERHRVPAADGRDHDDPTRRARAGAIRAEERQEGLGYDQLAREVDGDLMPKIADLEIEQRSRHGDAGIVDKAEQGLAVERLRHLRRARRHGRLAGYVEHQGREAGAEFPAQPVGVDAPPDAAEDAESAGNEATGARPADPGRHPGYHHRPHRRAPARWVRFRGGLRRHAP